MKSPGIKFLEDLTDFGIKLGLDKVSFLLKKLGNPHLAYPSVLIAGTNGKGSAAKFLSSILKESGYKTGLYTSPHLINVEERIKINGEDIPKDVFENVCTEIQKTVEKSPVEKIPTYFEALTAIAFYYFKEKKIDILVCEVGMGGKYDATNVLPSFLEIIMPVSFDHMEFLGNSLQEIAGEKAGIIKENSFLVSGEQKKEVEDVINRISSIKNTKNFFYPYDFFFRLNSSSLENGQNFNFYGIKEIENLTINIHGQHQLQNSSVAVQSALIIDKCLLSVKEESIRKGLEQTVWPARFQIISKNPLLILDGAHNYEGAQTLVKTLDFYLPGEKFIFLTGILKDKDYTGILKIFSSHASMFIFTDPQNPRTLPSRELQKILEKEKIQIPSVIMENPESAFTYLKERTVKSNSRGVICGSLYLAGDILKIVNT
ncbi:MAG: bifunctional folylpolyglutamate synthase/dihydrofolate synthase [Candidatus Omnitrophica bacterium]|nr:bifunctional folylpolyglutamate synthase/dihydrofolate synthase [Candidatus Omnitrophota bacterium]